MTTRRTMLAAAGGLSLTAVLAAVSLVSAVPLERRAGTGTKKAMGKTKLDASGAVYCKYIMYSSVCASTH